MRTCRCTHKAHEHKYIQQVMWPNDKEPPVSYRGACYKCNCCLFVDSRQLTLAEAFGEITIP